MFLQWIGVVKQKLINKIIKINLVVRVLIDDAIKYVKNYLMIKDLEGEGGKELEEKLENPENF